MLNYLGPSFRTAYRERQLKTYFERVYALWFLIFPQTEQEIRVNQAFLDDPDYEKHIVALRRKVGCFESLLPSLIAYFQLVHGKMCWASSLFPKISQEDGPDMDGPTSKVAWIREMNVGIQDILKEMPTPMWSDDILRRIQELGEGV